MSDALGHVLRHNAWANKALLDFCAALDPAALALNEHRGHATTILSTNGRDTPVISGWRYGIASGISVHDGDN